MGEVAGTRADGADALRRGVVNLLSGCAGARPGESLLILAEDESFGYYGPHLAEAVASEALAFGLDARLRTIPFSPAAETLPADLAEAVAAVDHTLFLARLGDQLRFRAMPQGSRPIVSYALDKAALSSSFGTAHYGAFKALKAAFDRLFANARSIRVTCALGSDFQGRIVPSSPEASADVTIKRFPMAVFAPIDAGMFRGRVAVAHLLCGTGSRYYDPFGIPLRSTLFAVIAGGRLIRWEGDAAEVARAERHYAHVAELFGIDAHAVHSWHAGIHPGCAYPGSAHDNYERWSGSAFGNPRLLHIHTCGAYAPGEICWNVVDPTIEVDGVRIWTDGRIRPEAAPGVAAILAAHPDAAALFERPERRIGLPPDAAN